jgi:hypothetical protein
MAKNKPDAGGENKAAGTPPNDVHADKPAANAPVHVNTPGPADTAGVGGSMPGQVTDAGRFDPQNASGAQPPENSGRDSGQTAGGGIPPAVGGPKANAPQQSGPTMKPGQSGTLGTPPGIPRSFGNAPHGGGAGRGPSPQRQAEGEPAPASGPVFTFGPPHESGPLLPGSESGADDELTLSHLVSELRQAAAAVKAHDYWTAARLAGHLLSHVVDAAMFVNSTGGPKTVGLTRERAEAGDREWGELTAACDEWERAKSQGVAFAPNARNMAWHQAGGAASGTAPAMGPGPAVGFDPSDIMRILEMVSMAVDFLRKLRKPR